MSQENDRKSNDYKNTDSKNNNRKSSNHKNHAQADHLDDERSNDVANTTEHTEYTEHLDDDDFSEDISKEDKASIKEIASDDNLSAPKSYASILVEQVIDAKETFNRSLGSLFTSAFTAGLEIGISLFVILSAFALLSEVMPREYAMVLASLLYPLGFIIVVIGQSLLFTEQTSLLS